MEKNSSNLIFCRAKIPDGNLGDVFLTKILVNELRSYGKLIVEDQRVPEWYCQELELTSDERASNYEVKFKNLILISSLRALFLLNPNKIYLIHQPGHWAGRSRFLNVVKTMLFLCLLRIIGVRFCVLGISLGFMPTLTQFLWQWKFKMSYFFSVRDSISKDYAHKIGIDKVSIFPDLAWLIEKPHYDSISPLKVDGDYVVFSFRKAPTDWDESTEYSAEYNHNLLVLLDEIVKLLCSNKSKKLVISYQVDKDRKFCQEMYDKYKNIYNVVFIERQIDSKCMWDLYSRASMVFSNRLHVLMFAMACGSLPVAIINEVNQHKIAGIFLDAGLKELILDIGKSSSGIEDLIKIAADAERIKEKISLSYESRQNSGKALLKQIFNEGLN
ncbi:MAG: polysaccharide pyruvyl transferase family protein [Cyanobacteria bacterium P01_G01_bin.39]